MRDQKLPIAKNQKSTIKNEVDVGVSVERDAACHDGKRERGKERAGAGSPKEGGRVRVPCVYINI